MTPHFGSEGNTWNNDEALKHLLTQLTFQLAQNNIRDSDYLIYRKHYHRYFRRDRRIRHVIFSMVSSCEC